MNDPKALLLFVLLAVSVATPAAPIARVQPRDVTVQLTVRTADGQPLANVGVGGETQLGRWLAVTDATGQAVANLQLHTEEQAVVAALRPALTPQLGTVHERRAAYDAMRTLASEYTFSRWYEVAVPAGQTEAQMTIEVAPALQANGRIVNTAGEPLQSVIFVRGAASQSGSGVDGTFMAGGLRPNVANELFIVTESGLVLPLTIPASPTDVVLGDVVVPASDGDGTLTVTVPAVGRLDSRREPKGAGITLVPMAGGPLFSFTSERDGRIVKSHGNPVSPSVPAGEYAVAPGLFLATAEQLATLDAVRTQGDLQAMGVPTITVVAGQEAVMEFNAVQVEAAVRQVLPAGQ